LYICIYTTTDDDLLLTCDDTRRARRQVITSVDVVEVADADYDEAQQH